MAKKTTATDVWWIRIYTEIYNDDKIRIISRKPGGYQMIWVWICLICLSGRTTGDGTIPLGQMAYTDEMLACMFNVEPETIRKSFETFQELGMIELLQRQRDDAEDAEFTAWIKNFGKHQFTDTLTEITTNRKALEDENRAIASGQIRFDENTPKRQIPEPETPYKKIVELYEEYCPKLRPIKRLTEGRKRTIRARYKEYDYDIEVFIEVFEKAGKSSFLNGENERGWQADFDWIIKPSNFAKVYEGKYNRNGGQNNDHSDTDITDYEDLCGLR